MARLGVKESRTAAAPPGLAGKWVMLIKWQSPKRFWRIKSGEVSANAILYDDEHGFSMEVHSPASDSVTKIAHWITDKPGSPVLYYVYEVVPKADGPQGINAYTGAAILHYYPGSDELRGNYWTNQSTVGQFRLARENGDGETSLPIRLGPEKMMKGRTLMRVTGAIFSAVLLGAVLWFLLRPSSSDDASAPQNLTQQQIKFAVTQASQTCLMDLSEQEQRSIEAG